MLTTITSFSSLYMATLLMLIGGGLFNTYMGLRLTAESVSEIWIGALIASYYLGLVCGARMGHKLIIRVGHIRAFVACAAISTCMILAQIVVDYMPVWLGFRLVAGIVMVTQLMVIESWLNEQTENHQRGRVFSVYMVVSGLGTVLGQLVLTAYSTLDQQPLVLVAACLVLCLVPIAVTARSHPPTPLPAPLDLRFFRTAGKVRMMADGSALWTRALGLELDLISRGLGVRSQRYSALLKDGVVTQLNVEAGGKFEVSDAATLLSQI